MTRADRWHWLASQAVLVLGLAWCVSGVALAQGPPRVRVEGANTDPVALGLISELRSSGFVVIAAGQVTGGDPQLASGERLDAVLRILPGAGVRIWWVDSAGVLVAEREVTSGDPREADSAVEAVRVVEVVRARLLPVERRSVTTTPQVAVSQDSLPPSTPLTGSSAPASEVPEPVPPPPIPPDVRPRDSVAPPPTPTELARAREAPNAVKGTRPATPSSEIVGGEPFGIDVVGMGLVGSGGIPLAIDLGIMPVWRPLRRIAVRAMMAVPLASPQLTIVGEGQASVAEWLVGGELEWSALPVASKWALSFGAGAAAARIEMRGVAVVAPFVGSSGADAWTSFPFGESTLTRALWSPHVRAMVQVLAGAVMPSVVIRFADRDVGSLGFPVFALSAGLEIDAR